MASLHKRMDALVVASVFMLLVLLAVVASSSTSERGNGNNKWRSEKRKWLEDMRKQVDSLETENKELRAVVFHLIRKRSQQQDRSKAEAAQLSGGPEELEQQQQQLDAQEARHLEEYVQRFERRMQEDSSDVDRESKLTMNSDRNNTIRMGKSQDDKQASTIHGNNAYLTFLNQKNVEFQGDRVTVEAEDELVFTGGESSVRFGKDGKQIELRHGESYLGLGDYGDTEDEKNEDGTWLRFGNTRLDFSSRGGRQVRFSTGNVNVSVTPWDLQEGDNGACAPVIVHGEHGSLHVGNPDPVSSSGQVELRTRNASLDVLEGNRTHDTEFFDYYISGASEASIAMRGNAEAAGGVGILVDGGASSSVVLSSGASTMSFSDKTYGTNISDSSLVDSEDVIFETMPGRHNATSSFHFNSGSARVKISEASSGTSLKVNPGKSVYVSGGHSSQGDPGNTRVQGGRANVENLLTSGRIFIGEEAEGFSSLLTISLSLNFTQLLNAQGDDSKIYAANVSLADLESDSCGVKGYHDCSVHDILFVNAPDAMLAGQILEVDSCLAYIWGKPYRDYFWYEGEQHVPMVNILIVQRLHAIENDRDDEECDPDMLF